MTMVQPSVGTVDVDLSLTGAKASFAELGRVRAASEALTFVSVGLGSLFASTVDTVSWRVARQALDPVWQAALRGHGRVALETLVYWLDISPLAQWANPFTAKLSEIARVLDKDSIGAAAELLAAARTLSVAVPLFGDALHACMTACVCGAMRDLADMLVGDYETHMGEARAWHTDVPASFWAVATGAQTEDFTREATDLASLVIVALHERGLPTTETLLDELRVGPDAEGLLPAFVIARWIVESGKAEAWRERIECAVTKRRTEDDAIALLFDGVSEPSV